MKIKIVFLVIILCLTSLYADRKIVGTTSYNFLKLTGSARSAAMSSAYTAVTKDVAAIFYNPAAAVSLKTNNVSMNYVNYYTDVSYHSIFFNMPHNENSNFLVGAFYLDGGQIDLYEGGDIPLGNARFYNLAVYLGYGSKIDYVNYAGTFKILNETILDDGILGFAFDFGFLIDILDEPVYTHIERDWKKYLSFSNIKFGLSFKNFGTTTGYASAGSDKLPFTTTMGLSTNYFNKYFFSLDYVMPKDNNTKINFGAEYYLNEYLTFRGGYRFKQEKSDTGFSAGAGFKFFLFYDMIFDISYQQNNSLGDISGVNITVIF
jgi:hypothetical protein